MISNIYTPEHKITMVPANDPISHPSHYVEGRKYEPVKVIKDWGLNFNLGNVVKYVSRAGRKGDPMIDLLKAREFLDFELAYLEGLEESVHDDN